MTTNLKEAMKIIVEEHIGAGYIYLNHVLPTTTVEFGEHYLVDLSDSSQVVGIEILDIHAGTFDSLEFMHQFKTEDKLAEDLKESILRIKRIATKR